MRNIEKNNFKTEAINEKTTISKNSNIGPVKESENYREILLPYSWKKVCSKRKNSDRWDTHVLSPQGKKLRSNIEIRKYLEVNPDIKCDRNVTNTSKKMVQIDSVSDKKSEEEGLEYVPKKGKRGPPAARSAIHTKKVVKKPQLGN